MTFLKKGAKLPTTPETRTVPYHAPVYILTEAEFKELNNDWKTKYEICMEKRLYEKAGHVDEKNELLNEIQSLKSTISNMDVKITLLESELDEMKLANDNLQLQLEEKQVVDVDGNCIAWNCEGCDNCQ
jgi:hypothetical protein